MTEVKKKSAPSSGVEVDEAIAQCKQIVHERRYSQHRFVVDLDRLLPSKSTLGRWSVQKYHQVYLQNSIFSVLHAKTQYEDVRQFMMEQLIAEETGLTCGSDTHYNLMRRFAESCGVGSEQFLPDQVALPVQRYVDTLLGIVKDSHFTVGLLTIYAIESQSGASVGRLLSSLRRCYDFSDAQLEWFTVHSEADDVHAETGVRLVRKYAPNYASFSVDAGAAVTCICDAWLELHDFYYGLLQTAPERDIASVP